jgi:Ca2+-binding RTX toxin-like protein
MFGAAGQDILFGEAGNDTLFGGTTCLDDPNADILVGGDGRDTLCGGDGRDILVGGLGADNLQGNAGDDVVLGGSVLDDSDLTQIATLLIAARSAWISSSDYLLRVAATRAVLKPGILSWDDRAADSIRGETGRDWLLGDRDAVLADNDLLIDRATNESFDQVVDRT